MGKKGQRGKSQQKKVTVSLFDFNQNVSVGADPALAALPSAPKAAEEWEAEGGRPNYNSRGYKERRTDPYADNRPSRYSDEDFDNREWTRKGPIVSGNEGEGFGMGPERNWDGLKRRPLDAEDSPANTEMNWSARHGPLDTDVQPQPERNWSEARKGPLDSEFPEAHLRVERDWTRRKGPMEAEVPSAQTVSDEDWGSARRTPTDSVFDSEEKEERDWTARKGPIEADSPSQKRSAEVDWREARREPIESRFDTPSPAPRAEPDWSARKGPLQAEHVSTQAQQPRTLDFGDARRAAKAVEAEQPHRETEQSSRFQEIRSSEPSRKPWIEGRSKPNGDAAGRWRRL